MKPRFSSSLVLLVASAALPRPALAHLMAPGHATVHALGPSVFSVVSLPASALGADTDSDGDGLVSQGELERRRVEVLGALAGRWRLFDGPERAEPVRIDLVLQPADNAPPAQADRADQIVMLHHARFSHAPREIALETDLFRPDTASASLVVGASRDRKAESATLRPGQARHVFFHAAPVRRSWALALPALGLLAGVAVQRRRPQRRHGMPVVFGLALLGATSGCANLVVGPDNLDLGGSPAGDGGLWSQDGPSQCSGPVTTAGVQCAWSHDAYNASASVRTHSAAAWSCSPTARTLTANGIPDHETGTFPNPDCPNTIRAGSVSASMTLAPALTGQAGSRAMIVGYAFNGVKFDPSTAGTCSVANGQTSCSLIGNTGNWNIEALGQSSFHFGVDDSNAHVQPTGDYHYHGMPTRFIDGLGKGRSMTLVGFAIDGFPIYAKYGYSDPTDASSGIKEVSSSWRVKSSPDANRPPVDTYPLGAFAQDYEYVAGLGDLDECNGRTGVTPEFPCGIYHYYITDTYPYIQRCLKGTPSGGDPGTMACTKSADCVGACGPMARGCGCGDTAMGMRCIPTCSVNADCPSGPMGQLSCRGGFCTP